MKCRECESNLKQNYYFTFSWGYYYFYSAGLFAYKKIGPPYQYGYI